MARKKVTLRRIQDAAARRTTFRKRRDGLMKKASELATLCNLKACVIVYGEGEAQPHVWPSVSESVPILERFKAMPELEQYKKTMNQEGFLRQRVDKLREQNQKLKRENHERQTMCLLSKAMLGQLPGSMGLTIEEVTSVGWMAKNYLKSIGDRIAELSRQASLQAPPAATYIPSNDMMTMGDPSLEEYLQMPQQEMWIDNVRIEGEDLSAGLYSDNGAGPSTTDLGEDLISWAEGFDFDASSSSFTPM